MYADNIEILKAKNADYSNNSENPFKNFEMVELFGITDVKTGILVRMTDKFARLINLTKKEANVQGETIIDTLQDLQNYAAILAAYLEYEDEKEISKRKV